MTPAKKEKIRKFVSTHQQEIIYAVWAAIGLGAWALISQRESKTTNVSTSVGDLEFFSVCIQSDQADEFESRLVELVSEFNTPKTEL